MQVSNHPVQQKGSRSLAGTSLVLLMLGVIMSGAAAGELRELQVTQKQGIYRMKMVAVVGAPAEYVRDVLTDYARIYRLNPSITESEMLPSPEAGVARVKTVMTGCVAFFCREVGRVEDVRELASGDLHAVIVPELSNLRSGSAKWSFEPVGKQTLVTYQASMEPDFFIPPLIGSFFVKQNIRKELVTSFARIECVARIKMRLERAPRLLLASLGADPGCGERCERNSEDCLQ
jgi:hypothetical protein